MTDETFYLNLKGSLPILSTVQKTLSKRIRTEEGRFRFKEIKQRMVENGEELHVVISEDDTKISERLRYDNRTDEVLGLQLPLDDDGKPISGSLKFTSLAAVQAYIAKYPRTTYAKLMTVRSKSCFSKAQTRLCKSWHLNSRMESVFTVTVTTRARANKK